MLRKLKTPWLKITLMVVIALGLAGVYWIYPWLRTRFSRTTRLVEWFHQVDAHTDWMVKAGERCGEAPFILPTDGYIGFLWGDAFRPWHRHQGIDIFGGGQPGETPVVAAYNGYLTRLPDWKSSLIIRIPHDPLQPARQIWIYYTHLADSSGVSYIEPEYPPGTEEKYVQSGTVLGYQGNYSGNPINPVGVHLHFSIVRDGGENENHPLGSFLNELEIRNTLDPSPYLELPLNAAHNQGEIVVCK